MSSFKNLENYIDSLDINKISSNRKTVLKPLRDYIQTKIHIDEPINLNFICTHNSRRSHLAQIWAQTISYYYNYYLIRSYSGGTEVQAVYPIIITTLKNRGFKIHQLANGINPIYSIKFTNNAHPIISFSKTWNDHFNPSSAFAAIMTCSDADMNCPFISGADLRLSLNYQDPTQYDNTNLELIKYEERSHQIATEMKYIFEGIDNSLRK